MLRLLSENKTASDAFGISSSSFYGGGNKAALYWNQADFSLPLIHGLAWPRLQQFEANPSSSAFSRKAFVGAA